MRRLRALRRQIPLDRSEAYDAAWSAFRATMERAGANAWRFRSAERDDVFIEFTEWKGDAAPPAAGEEAADLERLGAGTLDDWVEAPEPQNPADTPRARLLELLRSRSLKIGDFVLSSGKRASYYIDARLTTMSGTGQILIGRLGLDALDRRGWEPDLIGGLTLGADPIAYAIAHTAARARRPLDAFTIRKEAKSHGTGRRVEGAILEGRTVVICEDTITTGESALKAVAAAREANATVIGVLGLVDREEGGRARIEDAGLPVESLFTATELLA